MKPVPTAWAFWFGRCGFICGMPGLPCWPKRSAKRCVNSSIWFCCWLRAAIWVSASSAAPAFMVTATLTTAGVTLAARSEKSCTPDMVGAAATAAGAESRGTTSTGAVSAVVSARAARMVLVFVMRATSFGGLAKEIWDLAHGDRMAAALNVCIVGDRCVWRGMAADPRRARGDKRLKVKILLVEDDRQTADYIAKGLREHGHVVDHADNGRDGLYLATGEKYDVMIVDRMLPAMDGLSLVKAAPASNVRTPVLFLTTMGGIDDRVTGLEAGGDDYLVKPFAFAELLARGGAPARRAPVSSGESPF